MDINKITEYIDAPFKMQTKDLENLKSLVEKYPFFSTANLLYVKASHNINTEDYKSLIAKVSASVPNRELLFQLINYTAPVETESEKTKVNKKEESATRKEIHERIQKRRKSRMLQKGETLFNHGSSIHERIVKNFFTPVIVELLKDENNIGIMPDEISEYFPIVESADSKTVDAKNIEREKKALERKKRMEAKLKKRLEEQEKISPEALEKEKAEREKRRLEREKRMEERRLRKEDESQNTEEEVVMGSDEKTPADEETEPAEKSEIKKQEKTGAEVLSNERAEREKRRLEREKRMEERRLKREAESQNTEKAVVIDSDEKSSKKAETENVNEEKFGGQIEKDKTTSPVEHDPFTNIIDLENSGKAKKEKEILEKEAPENKDKKLEEDVSDDVIIILEEDTDEKIIEPKSEKQESENKENEEVSERIEKKDTNSEITKTKKKRKSKYVKTITEDIEVSEKEIEIEDIYDKIISSKKPATKEKYDFIEIRDDVTGDDEKNELLKEESEEVVLTDDEATVPDTSIKPDKSDDNKIITEEENVITIEETENVSSKTEDIEFEIEDTTDHTEQKNEKEITEKDSVDEKEKEVIVSQSDEVFELIEKDEEIKGESSNEEVKNENKAESAKTEKEEKIKEVSLKEKSQDLKTKETEQIKKEVKKDSEKIKNDKESELRKIEEKAKAAESVFARIEAFKKKRAELSKDDKNNITKPEEDKNNLINKFVREEPEIKRPSVTDDIDETIESAGDESVEKKPVVTELMASIYINQGKNDEAIDIYEKLILKNPEKKDYFAAKIDEIKKLNN